MRIDRDAGPFVAVLAGPALVAAALRRPRTAITLGVLAAAVAAFFRDPDRTPDAGEPIDPDLVLAPADGKVMYAGPAEDEVAPPGEWSQVSIFLSLADVHINRAPYGGRITEVTHQPGRFLAAYRAESANQNERTELVVEREVGGTTRRVVFRQVVGVLARRLVTRVAAGDSVATGGRIGLMRFGSRMDVFVPPEARLLVAVGQRVVAGETELARWT
jgi:phosphatidylserine decarboxylase